MVLIIWEDSVSEEKVNLEEVRSDGRRRRREEEKTKPEDTSRRCDYHVAQKKKQLLNGNVFIPPNKLVSAALKRSEEGND